MKIRTLLTAFGAVALIDYIADGDLDASKYVLNEGRDAVQSTWNAGVNQVNKLTQ